jgi:hypothetical protein
VVDTLSLVLPRSPIYSVLSSLPPPDATNPTSTITFAAQSAIHDSLPILEEIVTLLETHEEETLKKEIEKRRTRLGAAGPEQLRKEIGIDIWSTSQVKVFSASRSDVIQLSLSSSLRFTMKSLITQKRRMIFAEKLILNFYDTNSGTFMRYQIQENQLP